jgi:hypothetical protein
MAHPPRYTTGPATRYALSAAGALGATTGSVVHLPAPPTTAPAAAAVLAHELSHARQAVRRPRFLLAGSAGHTDDDERQALSTGRRMLGGLTGGAADGQEVGAGIVGELPVGRELGGVAEVATRAARAAVLEATSSAGGSPFFGGGGSPFGGGAAPDPGAGGGAPGSAPAGGAEPGGGGAGGAGGGPQSGESVVSGPGGAPASATALDPDRVVEVVQERLLREIERRGGRWVGVF